jgi:hypothetical protein
MAIQASRISVNKSKQEDLLVNTFCTFFSDLLISSQNLPPPISATGDAHWQVRWRQGAAAL